MQLHADRRRDLVALKEPCDCDRKQSLQTPKGRESEKNPDCHAESDGMRRVFNRHQPEVQVRDPITKARPRAAFARGLFIHSPNENKSGCRGSDLVIWPSAARKRWAACGAKSRALLLKTTWTDVASRASLFARCATSAISSSL